VQQNLKYTRVKKD